MSTIDTRREQMFPKLEPREIDRLRRFGDVRRYSAGEALFVTGEIAPGMAVLIKGSVRVTRRDPLGHRAPIVLRLRFNWAMAFQITHWGRRRGSTWFPRSSTAATTRPGLGL